VHGVFDPQYQGYGEKFLVRSYLNPNGMIWQKFCHISYLLPPEIVVV